jgi:hypothetical protein
MPPGASGEHTRIRSQRVLWDHATLAAQLGIDPRVPDAGITAPGITAPAASGPAR